MSAWHETHEAHEVHGAHEAHEVHGAHEAHEVHGARGPRSDRAGAAAPTLAVYRRYYKDNDFVVSPEGVLKLLSIVICILSCVFGLSGSICGGSPMLAQSAGGAALGCAVVGALLYGAALLGAPLLAPQAWLYTDIILSSVMGVLLLIMAVLTMTVCKMSDFVSYVNGLLGIVNACMVTGSAVIMYVSVMRLLDAARAPLPAAALAPSEQDA